MSNNLALVFPGQGSQAIGMLDTFAEFKEIIVRITDEASDELGYDMAELINKGPVEKLNSTMYTQPALLTVGYIGWNIWQHLGNDTPMYMAGHSLGEYSALVCAKAIEFGEALRLVARRGELMQNAVEPNAGAMAAIIGLSSDEVEKICEKAASESKKIVQPANLNSDLQTVIAGETAGVEAAIELAKSAKAKRALTLPVSVPSHCELMKSAAEELSDYIRSIEWKEPEIKVVHNFDVTCHASAEDICNALEAQLYSPVRWIEIIKYLAQNNIKKVVEMGPSKVLTGLNKRIVKDLDYSTFIGS